MSLWAEVRERARALLFRRSEEREMEEELRFHLDQEIDKNLRDGLKVLGVGELKQALTVRAHKFSKSAVEKIGASGGAAEVIG